MVRKIKKERENEDARKFDQHIGGRTVKDQKGGRTFPASNDQNHPQWQNHINALCVSSDPEKLLMEDLLPFDRNDVPRHRHLGSIPTDDILKKILLFVDLISLYSSSSVCRQWHFYVNYLPQWTLHYSGPRRVYPDIDEPTGDWVTGDLERVVTKHMLAERKLDANNRRSAFATGLCACCLDPRSCLDVCCCTLCTEDRQRQACKRMKDRPKSDLASCLYCVMCLPCACFISVWDNLELRERVVRVYGIKESDSLIKVKACCCCPCSLCQTHRELTLRGTWPGGSSCWMSQPFRHPDMK